MAGGSQSEAGPTRPRVMIADNNRQFLASLREVIEEFGVPVVGTAADGLQAVEVAMRVRPDVVVMDVKMGPLDSIEAAAMIRQQLHAVQVVILSAEREEVLPGEGRESVVFRHLVKGCSAETLLDALLDAWTASMNAAASRLDDPSPSQPPPEAPVNTPAADPGTPLPPARSPRVLVVDDEENLLSALCELLQDLDFAVVGRATNGREAVERAIELEPDVVLMDMRMPVLDGIEASRRIKEHDPSVQIVMLSAYEDVGLRQSAEVAGVYCYLVKGCSAMLIADMLRAAANHRGAPLA